MTTTLWRSYFVDGLDAAEVAEALEIELDVVTLAISYDTLREVDRSCGVAGLLARHGLANVQD